MGLCELAIRKQKKQTDSDKFFFIINLFNPNLIRPWAVLPVGSGVLRRRIGQDGYDESHDGQDPLCGRVDNCRPRMSIMWGATMAAT